MHVETDFEARAAFAALFDAHFDAVLAYARRRTAQLADAEDVVAEAFTIVWRRRSDLPVSEAERLPWLYGVARRVISNQRRGLARRQRLRDRLLAGARQSASAAPPSLLPVLDAMSRLRDGDREVLRLAAWEGLSHAEIAITLGITPNAAAIRLHRARRRLAVEMKDSGAVRTCVGWRGSVKHTAPGEDIS